MEKIKIMIRPGILLVLFVTVVNAQLNFEGNPLTDNTEYTAEESQTSARSSRQELIRAEHTQKLFPIANEKKIATGSKQIITEPTKLEKSVDRKANKLSTSVEAGNGTRAEFSRQFQSTVHDQYQQQTAVNPTNIALNSFLNSKTPEESRLSLDYYLRSQTTGADVHQQPVVESNQHLQRTNDQPNLHVQSEQILSPSSQVGQSQLLQSQLPQQQHLLPSAQVIQRTQLQQQQYLQPTAQNIQQQYLQPTYQNVAQKVPTYQIPQAITNNQHYFGLAPTEQNIQPIVAPLPQPVIHSKMDFMTPMGWRQKTRRIRGPPITSLPQSRIGPGYYKGPIPAPLKHKAPVEVIYTRPPGFHSGPVISNPPVPYEDASAFFPDVDHPPSSAKDIYYSQLYAQSYDPHYYNYIAKTGKIKPWLYGKFDKRQEEDGIWADLYRGFKKHGLKNMMSPGFLLGMTIPTAIALMLSVFVQKRSFARSDSREFSPESYIEEYFERIQKAVEHYEQENRQSEKTKTVDNNSLSL